MSQELPTITVNLLYWYMALGGLAFFGWMILMWIWYSLARNKELRFWLQRKTWAWSFMQTKLGDISRLFIEPKMIDASDNSFSWHDGRYYLKNVNDKNEPTRFSHRGKSAYHHMEGNPMPLAYGNPELKPWHSPRVIEQIKENAMAKSLAEMQPARTGNIMMWIVLILVLAMLGMVLLNLNSISNTLQHLLPSSASSTPGTGTGGGTIG